MSKPRKTSTAAAEMRAVAHTRYVNDLREGRVQRAANFGSGKAYKRRPKHRGEVAA